MLPAWIKARTRETAPTRMLHYTTGTIASSSSRNICRFADKTQASAEGPCAPGQSKTREILVLGRVSSIDKFSVGNHVHYKMSQNTSIGSTTSEAGKWLGITYAAAREPLVVSLLDLQPFASYHQSNTVGQLWYKYSFIKSCTSKASTLQRISECSRGLGIKETHRHVTVQKGS